MRMIERQREETPHKEDKAVFLIPYFGKIPDYFDLWAQSAGMNPSFSFFIFSDLAFDVAQYSNIRLIPMSFDQLKERIQSLMDFKITLHSYYKLCDYKPAYGHIFSEYIEDFDFWGFCDIDLIMGDISHFITKDTFDRYDKILYQGHFTLMRNTEKMKLLYRRNLRNVQDYRFAFTTKLDCHFDENGTIAYADEHDDSIRFGFDWVFFDTNVYSYELMINGTEAAALWENGILTIYWDQGKQKNEFMYIHLQKRKMIRRFDGTRNSYAIMRNTFLPVETDTPSVMREYPIDNRAKKRFEAGQLRNRKRILMRKIQNGWIICKLKSKKNNWKMQKKIKAKPLNEVLN